MHIRNLPQSRDQPSRDYLDVSNNITIFIEFSNRERLWLLDSIDVKQCSSIFQFYIKRIVNLFLSFCNFNLSILQILLKSEVFFVFIRINITTVWLVFLLLKDSGRWSLSPGDEFSSGVFSYDSQPDVQVVNVDLLNHTQLPSPCCFEGEIKH